MSQKGKFARIWFSDKHVELINNRRKNAFGSFVIPNVYEKNFKWEEE